MLIGPDIWGHENEDKLRAVFSWLARTGLGTHFGGSSIHHYQAVQVAVIDELTDRALAEGVIADEQRDTFEARVRQGDVDVRRPGRRSRWTSVGSVRTVSDAARKRSFR